MTTKQAEAIRKHGENLNKIFKTGIAPVELCKKLRRLEVAANKVMVDYCNGAIDYEQAEKYVLTQLRPALAKIIGEKSLEMIYINYDPRGYTLKLNEIESNRHSGIHKDWGGYVILAPVRFRRLPLTLINPILT